jgi:ribose/xylose/arabinose/galactoside ABC-type transport system permease subunit
MLSGINVVIIICCFAFSGAFARLPGLLDLPNCVGSPLVGEGLELDACA